MKEFLELLIRKTMAREINRRVAMYKRVNQHNYEQITMLQDEIKFLEARLKEVERDNDNLHLEIAFRDSING